MASLSFTHFSSLARWHSNLASYRCMNLVQLQFFGLRSKWALTAVSKKKVSEALSQEESDGEGVVVEKKTHQTSKRTTARSRKKEVLETPGDDSLSALDGLVTDEETLDTSASSESSKRGRGQRQSSNKRKVASIPSSLEEEVVEKKVTRRRRTKKKVDSTEDHGSETETSDRESDASVVSVELEKPVTRRRRTRKKVDSTEDRASEIEASDQEGDPFAVNADDDDDDVEPESKIEDGEDISFTYGWPPLVCCFGAVQHAFVPSGRQANRLIDHELREKRKEVMWTPEKFVRAPGGCASNVAVALVSLGGKVAFMGKVGDDDFGQSLIYYLNLNKVQTRSVCIDGKRVTAVSQMKIGKRGGLRMTNVKPCAEDCLSKSEINIDVLKEAKMFYFNSFSLLDRNMRSTTLHAIRIAKKLGGTIFYDVNLPLSLWQSSEETKAFIQKAWDLADIIEITKQELEFLREIKPSEKFDTKDNDRSKFTHYSPEVISRLWHEHLKILFVTNGTSKIHYFTKKHNGAVLGMEDAPITPYTSDMSASGDGIVAGLMRMLTVQPHLMLDKKYLERSINYAISCGAIDQWLQARSRGYPPKEGMEEEVATDPNGIKSITEREYRTLVPGSLQLSDVGSQ